MSEDGWERPALIARLDAVEARLASLAERPLPEALTEPAPGGEERWDAAQVWAHVAELVPYWLGEARRIADTDASIPVPYGRLPTDAIRTDAIEMRRHWSQPARWEAITASVHEVRRFVHEAPPEALHARGSHRSGAVRTVWHILERSITAHLEEHAEQLERLAAVAEESAAG